MPLHHLDRDRARQGPGAEDADQRLAAVLQQVEVREVVKAVGVAVVYVAHFHRLFGGDDITVGGESLGRQRHNRRGYMLQSCHEKRIPASLPDRLFGLGFHQSA
jgi:hypothetical protein